MVAGRASGDAAAALAAPHFALDADCSAAMAVLFPPPPASKAAAPRATHGVPPASSFGGADACSTGCRPIGDFLARLCRAFTPGSQFPDHKKRVPAREGLQLSQLHPQHAPAEGTTEISAEPAGHPHAAQGPSSLAAAPPAQFAEPAPTSAWALRCSVAALYLSFADVAALPVSPDADDSAGECASGILTRTVCLRGFEAEPLIPLAATSPDAVAAATLDCDLQLPGGPAFALHRAAASGCLRLLAACLRQTDRLWLLARTPATPPCLLLQSAKPTTAALPCSSYSVAAAAGSDSPSTRCVGLSFGSLSVLDVACLAGQAAVVRTLLARAPLAALSPRLSAGTLWSCLHYAVLGGSAEVLSVVLPFVLALVTAGGRAAEPEAPTPPGLAGAPTAAAAGARRRAPASRAASGAPFSAQLQMFLGRSAAETGRYLRSARSLLNEWLAEHEACRAAPAAAAAAVGGVVAMRLADDRVRAGGSRSGTAAPAPRPSAPLAAAAAASARMQQADSDSKYPEPPDDEGASGEGASAAARPGLPAALAATAGHGLPPQHGAPSASCPGSVAAAYAGCPAAAASVMLERALDAVDLSRPHPQRALAHAFAAACAGRFLLSAATAEPETGPAAPPGAAVASTGVPALDAPAAFGLGACSGPARFMGAGPDPSGHPRSIGPDPSGLARFMQAREPRGASASAGAPVASEVALAAPSATLPMTAFAFRLPTGHSPALDLPDAGGNTPLALACALGRRDMVAQLLRGGACRGAVNRRGDTPLMHALRAGSAGAALQLLLGGDCSGAPSGGQWLWSGASAAADGSRRHLAAPSGYQRRVWAVASVRLATEGGAAAAAGASGACAAGGAFAAAAGVLGDGAAPEEEGSLACTRDVRIAVAEDETAVKSTWLHRLRRRGQSGATAAGAALHALPAAVPGDRGCVLLTPHELRERLSACRVGARNCVTGDTALYLAAAALPIRWVGDISDSDMPQSSRSRSCAAEAGSAAAVTPAAAVNRRVALDAAAAAADARAHDALTAQLCDVLRLLVDAGCSRAAPAGLVLTADAGAGSLRLSQAGVSQPFHVLPLLHAGSDSAALSSRSPGGGTGLAGPPSPLCAAPAPLGAALPLGTRPPPVPARAAAAALLQDTAGEAALHAAAKRGCLAAVRVLCLLEDAAAFAAAMALQPGVLRAQLAARGSAPAPALVPALAADSEAAEAVLPDNAAALDGPVHMSSADTGRFTAGRSAVLAAPGVQLLLGHLGWLPVAEAAEPPPGAAGAASGDSRGLSAGGAAASAAAAAAAAAALLGDDGRGHVYNRWHERVSVRCLDAAGRTPLDCAGLAAAAGVHGAAHVAALLERLQALEALVALQGDGAG